MKGEGEDLLRRSLPWLFVSFLLSAPLLSRGRRSRAVGPAPQAPFGYLTKIA